ncbi:YncE family protein [Methylovirgula sp. 4M-Z18]|nr:YncE family protein [Methylovirgula sp. 4M-Z18]
MSSASWAATAPAPSYHVAATTKIGGEGGWDYLAYDTNTHHLFVTRVGGVLVEDVAAQKSAGTIPAIAGTRVHGIALASDLGIGFTGDGKDNTSTVFSLKDLKVLRQIDLGHAPDAVIYDPHSKRGFAFAGDDNLAVAFDPHSGKRLGEVALDGSPEYAAADGAGNVYVNISDKQKIARIDAQTLKVTSEWAIGGGCEDPTPLAIDTKHRHLYVGCRSGVLAVLSADDGSLLASLPIGKGTDAIVFDPSADLAFISCGDGTVSVVRQDAAGKFEIAQVIKTAPGARTLALDPSTHRLYLPVSDQGPMLPKTEELPSRPAIVPETFRLLTVDP